MKDISFLKENLIAHRGYHNAERDIPENSLLAFQKALEKGLTIELDVHLLKDGKVVVFHDNNLKRMTGIDKDIKDIKYFELSSLYLQNTKEKIPLLEDVLALIDGKVPLIIELKSYDKKGILEKNVINILKDYQGQYAIKSFNPYSLWYFKWHYPKAIRGQLIANDKNRKALLLSVFTKPDFISCNINYLSNKRIKKFRKNGLVLGWTVRCKDDYEIAKGNCDNIIFENTSLKDLER